MGKPILSMSNLKRIFSDSLPIIINYNTLLYNELFPRIESWSPSVSIGDVFLRFVSILVSVGGFSEVKN